MRKKENWRLRQKRKIDHELNKGYALCQQGMYLVLGFSLAAVIGAASLWSLKDNNSNVITSNNQPKVEKVEKIQSYRCDVSPTGIDCYKIK